MAHQQQGSGVQGSEMSEELKPCPFCNGKAQVETLAKTSGGEAFVYCLQCDIWGPMFSQSSEAIQHWNTRSGEPYALSAEGEESE